MNTERSVVESGEVQSDFRRGVLDSPGLVSGSGVPAVGTLEVEDTASGEDMPVIYPGEPVDEDDGREPMLSPICGHARISSARKRVSRKDILTDSLDYPNIPWEWDPEDDYYVFVKEHLTKDRWQELRQHTAQILKQRL